MKRKRALEQGETPQETVKVKKHKSLDKSQVKSNANDDNNSMLDKNTPAPKNTTKKSLRSKSHSRGVEHVDTETDKAEIGKKKRAPKKDINHNGDLDQVVHSEVLPSVSKIKKKNGLQARAASDSPSDFQPLGCFVKKEPLQTIKHEELIIKDEPDEVPIKKRRGRKPKTHIEEHEENNPVKVSFDKRSPPPVKHGVLKSPNKGKEVEQALQNDDPATTNVGRRKPKKKVRIDETESLKVKKELAEAEPHFSAKQLPAKIIKSKSNKNLTEEVKVSPLTVQNSKREKSVKGINAERNFMDEDSKNIDRHVENGIEHQPSTTSEESDLEVYYINKNAEKEARKTTQKHSITMPKEDQLILVERMQEVIPENDTKSYKYRLQKLEWQNVAFKNYSLEECQKVWAQLYKKVRHYRLLIEVTHDVKQVIELNDMRAVKPTKQKSSKKHPDMPKRPLSAYLLYYIREKDKMGKDRPEIDMIELTKAISEKYHNLALEKKQKYELLALKNKEIYRHQMEEFYAKHPEMRKVVIKKEAKKRTEKPPKRPENPYRLFAQAELDREEIAEEDKAEFKEVCREKWVQMSDSKKLSWINRAEEHLQNYEKELKEYMARHPDYTPRTQPYKSFLSRQEINLKDKLAGKPKKPPGTAYGLFISMNARNSETMALPPRERWNYTSLKWKTLKDEEREQYKQLLAQANEQYQKDFNTYLDSLPEEKRQEEILKSLPKRRKKVVAADKPSTSGTKSKAKSPKSTPSKAKDTKQKVENPAPPPRSAYKYFVEKYDGENPKEAWKNLSVSEKEKYEEELSTIKGKYIEEFETYLKSLTKEELAEFCANRSAQAEYSSSDESDSESDHGDEESSDDESSDNSDSENDSDEN